MRFLGLSLLAFCLVAPSGSAQTSPNYMLAEHSFNAGGQPLDAVSSGSASLRLTLGSIGDVAIRREVASPSFRLGAGFATTLAPPAEVGDLHWSSDIELTWDADASAGTYNLYRGSFAALPESSGACLEQGLATTHYVETATPSAGEGFFYLVTAENRLNEEGNHGAWSDGTPRPGLTSCP